MKNKYKLLILFGIILLIALTYTLVNFFTQPNLPPSNLSDNTAVKIIDGDTFELASGEKVRLICIDAPELGTEQGELASEYLSSLILNKELRLEKDTTDRDQYGRLLRYAYVSLGNEEIFINKELVAMSYASVFRYGNDTSLCDEISGLAD